MIYIFINEKNIITRTLEQSIKSLKRNIKNVNDILELFKFLRILSNPLLPPTSTISIIHPEIHINKTDSLSPKIQAKSHRSLIAVFDWRRDLLAGGILEEIIRKIDDKADLDDVYQTRIEVLEA